MHYEIDGLGRTTVELTALRVVDRTLVTEMCMISPDNHVDILAADN